MGRAATGTDVRLAGGAAVLAALLVLLAGRRGLGLSPDSLEYLGVARNLLHGKGLTLPFGSTGDGAAPGAPMTSFPPLYPIVLAAGGAGLLWARMLNLLLVVVTAASVASVVGRHATSRLAAACVTALFLAPDFVRVQVEVWSEPLLLALVSAGTVALLNELDRPRRSTLAALCATCALAPMTRYVGVVFVIAVVVALARHGRRTAAAMTAAAGVVPLSCWLAYGAARGAGAGGRTVAWHPPAVGTVAAQLWRTVGTFWLSGYGPWLGVVVIALLAACGGPRRGEPLGYASVLGLGSVAVLLATWTLLDRTTVLDSRLLILAHLGAVLALARLVRAGRGWRDSALALAATLVVIGSAHWGWGFAASDSRQYAADSWRRSPTLAAAGTLPRVPIYSNRADIVWWVTGRAVALVPLKADLRSGAPRDWRRAIERLPAGARVLLFDRAPGAFVPTAPEVASVRPLRLEQRLRDGAIYQLGPRVGGRD